MPFYKLYCIGADGHISMRHDVEAKDDDAALERARELCGPHEIEIWDCARFVTRIDASGNVKQITDEAPHKN